MKLKTLGTLAAMAVTAATFPVAANGQLVEKTAAFPGAEGFGRYTTGGRGGNVYHVTNLRDSGTGSLRWALSQSGPRTIVFDVSGTIHLSSGLDIPANTTIAGQTAPGDGICIADYPVRVGSNNVIRYMRFRLGNKYVKKDGADGWDGLSAMDAHDLIIDHCSVSWSIDECCSVLGNHNTTLQWSIVAQSLVESGHTKGSHGYGGNWGGTGASFHHNLMIHHTSRTPRLGPRPSTQLDERMDMRNNVIYNFGGNGCYGGEAMTVNIVNNYYKPGPGSPTDRKGRRIAGIGIRTEEYVKNNPSFAPALHIWGKYFVEGNFNSKYADVTRDNWNYGMYNQIDTSSKATDGTWNDEVKKAIRLSEPMPYVKVTTHSAETAFERVLDYAGASLSRDSHDALMVSDARDGKATYTGSGLSRGFINSQDDNRPADAPEGWSAWPVLNSTEAPVDTDGDGMPDAWEEAHGLNPKDASDRNGYTDEGYTNLEVYLNSLVDHITTAQNEGGEMSGDAVYYDEVKECYEMSMNTKLDGGWDFSDDISISNDRNGGYTSRGEYVGLGRDIRHTVTLPVQAEFKWVKITGVGRYTTSSYTDASLIELNGKSFETGVHTLPKGDVAGEIKVPFEPTAKRFMTMTWAGNNPFLKLELYTTDFNGVESVTVDANGKADEWYNLQGMRVERPTVAGVYIHNGKKEVVR